MQGNVHASMLRSSHTALDALGQLVHGEPEHGQLNG